MKYPRDEREIRLSLSKTVTNLHLHSLKRKEKKKKKKKEKKNKKEIKKGIQTRIVEVSGERRNVCILAVTRGGTLPIASELLYCEERKLIQETNILT